MKTFAIALGATLVASLAFASMAFASPLYIKLKPEITPTTPQAGHVAETSKGIWGGGIPTSYEFAWKRCNSKGEECTTIAGATSQTYTPVQADVGKTLVSAVTASNAEGSTTALSNPSGIVFAIQRWYVGGSRVAEGTPAPQSAKTAKGSVFAWIIPYGPLTFKCTSYASTGTVENPLGGGVGLGEATTFTFGGCTREFMSSCTLQTVGQAAGTVTLNSLREDAVEFENKPAVKFTSMPGWGETLTEIEYGSECGGAFSNLKFTLRGSFIGVQESGSNLTFTQWSTSGITINWKTASFTGKSTMTSTGGAALALGL